MNSESRAGALGRKGKIRNFRDLEVWQLGMQVVVAAYEATKSFPREETYGLTSQMRRAAVSIPSNIAEGFNRYHNADYRRILYVALGSCAELETQVELATLLGYVPESVKDGLIADLVHEERMLRNLIKRLGEREA